MGQKAKKGEISISKAGDSIRLRWRVKGTRYSFNPPNLYYNSENLIVAKLISATIKLDILNGCFDPTLEKYRSPSIGRNNSSHVAPFVPIIPVIKPDLVKSSIILLLFDKWTTEYINADPNNPNYYNARAFLKRIGNFQLGDFVSLLNKENWSSSTYNVRLSTLKKFFVFLVKQGTISYNPIEHVCRRRNNSSPNIKRLPIGEDDIFLFLEAIKNDAFCSPFSGYKHSFYYPFFYFVFRTGVRNAEAIGLRVRHINFNTGFISIEEVLARTKNGTNSAARIRKNTKNTKERLIPITEDLKEILLKQTENKQPDDLVFTSFREMCIDDRMLQRRVYKPVMKKLGLGDKDLYVARHSFGTAAIEQGFSPSETAQLMGNTTETLLRRYVKLLNAPKRLPNLKK